MAQKKHRYTARWYGRVTAQQTASVDIMARSDYEAGQMADKAEREMNMDTSRVTRSIYCGTREVESIGY